MNKCVEIEAVNGSSQNGVSQVVNSRVESDSEGDGSRTRQIGSPKQEL